MIYNTLGNTGLLVSELCFGTMTFGGDGYWKAIGEQPQDVADALIKQSVEGGINFIDTANIYSYGMSEEILGNSIRNLELDRDELVIATKVRGMMGPQPNNQGLSRYHIFNSMEKSLDRLQLDHVDLLYVHGVDSITPVKEIMRTLNDLVEAGYTRYVGVCNWPAWMVAKAQTIAEYEGWHGFKAMQYYYSVAGRDAEQEVLPLARKEELGFMPWSPLAGGFLSGKYTRDNEKAGDNSRRDNFDFPPVDKEYAYDIIDKMQEIATKHDVTVAEIALAWVRHQHGVTSTIIGAKNAEQLASNLRSVEIELSDEDLKVLNDVSDKPTPYPGWMVERQDSNRFPHERD
ncbi:MAG TPA: aldo/keto reductase [Balneolaceae bacterium]|nr:aldo/keto reductase [Balneolaceae bacterium]